MTRGPEKSTQKFATYFRVMEALKQPGCVICRLLQKAVHNHLDSLFYEQVNDGETRTRLRRSLGFCREHAQAALAMNDAFGMAIIYDDILETLVTGLGARRLPQRSQECPLCTTKRAFEKLYVEAVRHYCADPDFQEVFSSSSGLCVPHFRLVSEDLEEPCSTFLFSSQERLVKQSIHHLREFIRKHDYRFLNEKFSEAEAGSCTLAVRLIAGE